MVEIVHHAEDSQSRTLASELENVGELDIVRDPSLHPSGVPLRAA